MLNVICQAIMMADFVARCCKATDLIARDSIALGTKTRKSGFKKGFVYIFLHILMTELKLRLCQMISFVSSQLRGPYS